MKWLLLHQFSALDLFCIAVAIKIGNSYGGAQAVAFLVVAMVISYQSGKRWAGLKP